MKEPNDDDQPLGYASPDTDEKRPDTPYQRLADKVGCVPTFRGSDNAVSAIGGAGGAVVLLAIAYFGGASTAGVIASGIVGLILGVVATGAVMAVVLLFRKKR
ncbi:MAG: hypothetical protein AAF561_08995 [Planctomycetota bacterium]